MDKTKKAKLEAAGWTVGGVQDFLDLSDEDVEIIELRLALASALKNCRIQSHLSQVEAAKRIKSSQSRLAKMEAADPSVTLDLLIRAFFRLGGDRKMMVSVLAQ